MAKMNKTTTLNVRVSQDDIDNLDYCQKALGVSRSDVIRQAVHQFKEKIERLNNMKKQYIEVVTRKGTDYKDIYLHDREMLLMMLENDVAGKVDDPVKEAIAIAERIDAGETVTLDGAFVCTFKIATDEEIEEAKVFIAKRDAEIFALELPSIEKILEDDRIYREN